VTVERPVLRPGALDARPFGQDATAADRPCRPQIGGLGKWRRKWANYRSGHGPKLKKVKSYKLENKEGNFLKQVTDDGEDADGMTRN